MKNAIKLLLLIPLALMVSCEKSTDPDKKESGAWSPPHSQPRVLPVPDQLKTHADPYAKRVYAGIKELEDLIAVHHQYFLVPEGTENKSGIPTIENKFSYERDGLAVEYAFFDYLSSHRVFELEVKRTTGESVLSASGDWWPDWDAEAGGPRAGKNYGTIAYRTPQGSLEQNKEFSWKDDGGGQYRVTYQVWNPGTNSGLAEKYEYQFNADKSGSFTYWEYRTNGGGDYIRADWQADGSGKHVLGEGGLAVTNEWQ